MSQNTARFITRMKLRELSRQRDRLREAYRRVGESAGEAENVPERIARLYHGLRGVDLAGKRLLADLANLEVLLEDSVMRGTTPAVQNLWRERLEKSLEAGQRQAEFVYLFGALLEEWTRDGDRDEPRRTEAREAQEAMLASALSAAAPEPDRHREILLPLLDAMHRAAPQTREAVRKALAEALKSPGHGSLSVSVLSLLEENPYHLPALRREAKTFSSHKKSLKELEDALRILASEVREWDWSDSGVGVYTLWTRNRWRLYLNADLPTVALLESVGKPFSESLTELWDASAAISRRVRLQKLVEISAPDYLIAHQFLRPQFVSDGVSPEGVPEGTEAPDIWTPRPDGGIKSGSVLEIRERKREALRRSEVVDNYEYGGGGANPLVQLVNAEIRLARAAFPDQPLYVVKADLKDYYASLPHPVLLTLLEQLGVEEGERDLLGRFVSPVVRTDGGGAAPRVRRGVPMNFTLSVLLAELVMRFLDRHIRQDTKVRTLRLVDDICLLTPHREDAVRAWERLREFCDGCGLALNEAKCGALCLGGGEPLPDPLPQQLPNWGMLELDEAGEWRVGEEVFAAHLARTRERVGDADSVLGKVEQYNAGVRDLLNALALACPLGDRHRESTGEAVRRFHEEFLGPGQGLAAHLSDTLQQRFGISEPIPEAWVYWPITAGGLGLKNPLISVAQYALAARDAVWPAPPETRPEDWETSNGEWSAFYATRLETLTETEPESGGVMETLVQDFIRRGKEISGDEQVGLSGYWRWVLYTYGPQILERFGTFRFLITELVPMQLIRQQKWDGPAALASEDAGDDPEAIFF